MLQVFFKRRANTRRLQLEVSEEKEASLLAEFQFRALDAALAVNNNDLPFGLVSFRHPMSLTDLLKPERPNRLDVQSARSSVSSDLPKRHVRKGKSRSSENKACEECQVDATCHLQQRVEIADRIQSP